MHNQHDVFIDAIHTKKKLRIRFYSEDDGRYIERVCAPMDHAAGTRIKDGIPRTRAWVSCWLSALVLLSQPVSASKNIPGVRNFRICAVIRYSPRNEKQN